MAKKEQKEKKIFKCKHCGAEFERSVDLARHVRLEHKRKKDIVEPEEEITEKPAEEKEIEEVEVTEAEERGEPEEIVEQEKEETTEIEKVEEEKVEGKEKEEKKEEEEEGGKEKKEEIGEAEEIKEIPKTEIKAEVVKPKEEGEEKEKEVVERIIETPPPEIDTGIRTPPPERVDITSTHVIPQPPVSPAEEMKADIVKADGRIDEHTRVKQIKDKYEPLLLRYPEVTGVGVGRTADGRPGIEILVCHGCPEHEDIPKNLDGVPVFIHEVGEVHTSPVEPPKVGTKKESATKAEEIVEPKETLIDKVAHAKKLGIFFEGPIRKSIRKWLRRRREEKSGRRRG